MKKRKRKKLLSFSLKLSLSLFLILLVVEKLDLDKFKSLVKAADVRYFVAGFFFIVLAQIWGALRMRFNLREADFIVSRRYSIGMYFMGILFNIILPGGIGGDGFRAYYYHKRFKFPWQKTIVAILRGRSSGLFFLIFFLLAFAFFYKEQLTFIPYIDEVLIAGMLLLFPCYSICTRYFLKEPLRTQLKGLHYSFFSQLFFLLATVCVLYGLGNFDHITGYIMVFLMANIVAVIPISFGGIGLREFTYISLASHIGLSSDVGVAVSLLYYALYTSTAFIGLIPYALLRKMDYLELKYQREINYHKYAIVDDVIEDEDRERVSADGS